MRCESSRKPKTQKMNQAIRSIRIHYSPPSMFLSFSNSPAVLRFKHQQVSTVSSTGKPENPHDMDKAPNPNEKTRESRQLRDVMSHSFGDGYATRSDEEGFGGIYGGNHEEIHEDHPEYDKSQGSEVKEKEKARHQSNLGSEMKEKERKQHQT